MKNLKNFKYEIFIDEPHVIDGKSSCTGKHLEIKVWGCEDDSLINIAQRLANQLRCADYEIGCIKAESDFLDDSLDDERIVGQCFNPD